MGGRSCFITSGAFGHGLVYSGLQWAKSCVMRDVHLDAGELEDADDHVLDLIHLNLAPCQSI